MQVSRTYQMRRFTVVAPHVRNSGAQSDYPAAFRHVLLNAGIDGWTESETHGSWRGKREAGTTFSILMPIGAHGIGVLLDGRTCVTFADILGALARRAMGAEQEAIQVTIEPGVVDVIEA